MTETLVHDATIGQIIESIAQKNGVDPILASVDAWLESGLRPNAVGDNGTSFGLYQLHEGGELGSLTRADAFNPITNAATALPEFAAVKRGNESLNPGQVAAAAQRPANESEYADNVNALYEAVSRGQYPAGYEAALNAHTGLTVTMEETVVDPTTPPIPVAEPSHEVTVTLPVLGEGLGMPPSEPNGAVWILQSILAHRGIACDADGEFGAATAEALKAFQSSKGLAITGNTDAATWVALIG